VPKSSVERSVQDRPSASPVLSTVIGARPNLAGQEPSCMVTSAPRRSAAEQHFSASGGDYSRRDATVCVHDVVRQRACDGGRHPGRRGHEHVISRRHEQQVADGSAVAATG